MQAYILKKSHVAAEFSQGSTLKTHMATHTGEKKKLILCQECGAVFPRSDNLKRHMKTHTGAGFSQ